MHVAEITVLDESILNADMCITSPALVCPRKLFYKRNM